MVSRMNERLFRAVLGGFLIGSGLIGYAQEDSTVGVVRITDSRPRGVPVRNVGFKSRGDCYDGSCEGDMAGISGCPHCNGGGCPHCMGGNCFGGHCFGGHCKYGHCKLGHCFQEHYCCDGKYGYSPPSKFPIWRRGVQYNQYFPSGWYGTPSGGIAPGIVYPQIYMPTDTTQLGFYYQHVPFWQPNPNALPPRPIPAQWHSYEAVWGGGACPACYAGAMNGATTSPTPTPDGSQPMPTPPSTTEPPPVPVPDQEAAPVPTDAERGLPIRRASLEQ